MFKIYIIVIAVMSLATLIAFAIDKAKSANEANSRFPEMVLLSLCTFGGAAGGLIGMYVIRHKTNPVTKFHFAITVWLSAAAQAVIAAMMIGGAA